MIKQYTIGKIVNLCTLNCIYVLLTTVFFLPFGTLNIDKAA